MSYKDVREWIRQVEEMGELKIIEGADWNLEIGALSVLASKHKENSPALLFDRIKDYPAGYRILVGFFESLKRSALTTNLPLDITREGFIKAWRERLAKPVSIPPVTVAAGPVLENVFSGDDIDLFKFPVPFWHERDGGRYIGTGYVVIAIEGEFLPDQGKEEGPFSEWTGYYASGEKYEPLIKVHRLYHRNDPIITGSPEYRPTARAEHCYELLRAAYIRDQVEKAGVPDVQAVASYFRRFLTVISIRQRYPGHARQAGLVA